MKPYELGITLERLSRILQNETRMKGLMPNHWEVLRFLARANRFSRSPSGVAIYLGTTKGTVSQSLNALEHKGFVRKETDPADRRNVHLALTDLAVNLLQSDPINAILDSVSDLNTESLHALTGGLQSILINMLDRRGGRAFSQCKTCRYFRIEGSVGASYRCALLDEHLSINDSEQICVEHEVAA
jgi:DNA-binding MarR family transcriptional regulator